MKIEIQNNRIKIKLSFFEKILSFSLKDKEYEFIKVEKAFFDPFEHPIKISGVFIPKLLKYGSFSKVKNKKLFLLGLMNILLLFPILLILAFKYNQIITLIASFVVLIFGIKIIYLSSDDKSFYLIKNNPKEVLIFYLKENKDGFKKLFLSLDVFKQ